METPGPWSTADFDDLSWHDVHVHGLHLYDFDESNGSADLVLDIDFILSWDKSERGVLFTVCPADLRFHDVFGLKLSLDYASSSAGMCPFSVAGIERDPVTATTASRMYSWRIPVNWPKGSLEFQASGFTQALTGSPVVQHEQCLQPEKRRRVV